MKKNSSFIHIIIALIFLIFSILKVLEYPFPVFSKFSHYKISHEKFPKYTGDNNNPIHRSSISSIPNSLYFLVLDDEYRPMPHQCLSKKLWMNEMLKDPHVDAIEWYSINHWTNTECNITPITVPPPKQPTFDPSSHLLYHALHNFIQRSNANFLCIIGDAAYIRVKEFINFFDERTKGIDGDFFEWAVGNCIEHRYFFRMHAIEPGIIVSRQTILQMLQKTQNWEIAISLMHHSDETFGQIIDSVGIYVPPTDTSLFLGRRWEFNEDFQNMLIGNYSYLPDCVIPLKNFATIGGELTSCNKKITQLKKVISWAGGGDSNKTAFLQNVERIYKNLPNNIGFYWNCRHPQICKIIAQFA